MIENALFLTYFVALVVAAMVRRTAFLFLLGAAFPLIVPRLNVGIGLDWYKVAGPLAVGLALLRRQRGQLFGASRAPLALWIIIYAAVVTLIWMYFEYTVLERYRLAEAMETGMGSAQTKLKMPVQLVGVVGQFMAVLAVPLWARSLKDCRAAMMGLMSGTAVSVLAGGVYWLGTGLATVLTTGEEGTLVLGAVTFPRLGGLTGEPKHLGVVAALLLIYVVSERLLRSSLRLTRGWWVAALLAVVFLTFSTSAWAALAMGLAVVVALALFWAGGRQIAVALMVGGLAVVLVSSVGFIASVVESRFINRLFGEGDLEQQKDMYVFLAFRDQPLHSVFGYGLGGADLAVTPYMEWLHLKYKRTPTPGVTGVRLLGDLGAVGLALIVGVALSWAQTLRRRMDRAAASFVLGGLVCCLTGSIIGLSVYFFIAGALLAAAALKQQERQTC